jgi:hypothetical protein
MTSPGIFVGSQAAQAVISTEERPAGEPTMPDTNAPPPTQPREALSYHKPSRYSLTDCFLMCLECFSVFFGIMANCALGLWALSYLTLPHGQVFTQSTGLFLALVSACAILVAGFVLSFIDMFIRRKWIMGFCGLLLAATPFPLFFLIFEIIAWVKGFRFI